MKLLCTCITAIAFALGAVPRARAADEMPAAAKKLGCTACHAIDKKIVGPAWRDVAKKYTGQGVKTYTYKGKEYPLIEGLVMKVSMGGSGNWGVVMMPPNDPKGVHKDDITALVKFEQGLAAGGASPDASPAATPAAAPAPTGSR
jgi:cytochrome c551/c552